VISEIKRDIFAEVMDGVDAMKGPSDYEIGRFRSLFASRSGGSGPGRLPMAPNRDAHRSLSGTPWREDLPFGSEAT
jgi:hypothetical protein